MLHRDLKPGNVFVGTGQSLKVGDFGMSRYVDLAVAAGALDCRLTDACLLCTCMLSHGRPTAGSCMLDGATYLRSPLSDRDG